MLIQFNPTEKLSAILRNNTSAADSFPGWPNGVAKASAVGRSVGLPAPQFNLVHRCDWWGYGNHPDIGVKSNDAGYAAQTVSDMVLRGFEGCTLDWYGPGSHEDVSLLALKKEIEHAGLKFALMIDGGSAALKAATDTASRTAALNKMFDYAAATYFPSPAYLRRDARPIVLFFGVSGVDLNAVRSHLQASAQGNPLLFFRWERGYSSHAQADGYFGWTHCDEAWVTAVKQYGKLIMLGCTAGFNSSIKTAPVLCTWGSGTIIPQRGGQLLEDQLALAAAHPEIPYTHFVTWNDYQEGSAIEPGIATGFALTLGISNNVLEWNPPPAPFDHVTVYLSRDGENLMPLARTPVAGGVTSLDLAALEVPDGTWTFVVVVFGKSSIQHVAGSLTETLGWRP